MQNQSGIVVMKFGGTSVQDSDSIKNVINIVKNNPLKKVVVVSAISKATTALENIARFAAEKNIDEAHKLLKDIINRHHVIIDELVTDGSLRSKAT